MNRENKFRDICRTENKATSCGGFVKALSPRSIYDAAICGVCAHSHRLIYSEFALIDILTNELLKQANFEGWLIAPEVYERFQDEAISLYNEFLRSLAYANPLSPIFLKDEDETP